MSTLGSDFHHPTTRRGFLAQTARLNAVCLLGVPVPLLSIPRLAAAEPLPETTRIRLTQDPAICLAPQYLAEELLRIEGFAEIEFAKVPTGAASTSVLASGAADIKILGLFDILPVLDREQSVLVLSGIHVGCYELFGNDRVLTIRDLKGKTVAVSAMGAGDHLFLASMLAYVGVDPRTDINWSVTKTYAESMRLFNDGAADAFLAFPPQSQELRAKKMGNVIVDTVRDRPWSQYFCCVVAANRQFVARHPVATKRALRALLKATDMCASQPEEAARVLVAKGYEPSYATALDVLQKLHFTGWRDTSPEDSLRFHSLRLHEVGMIRSTPHKLIAQSTDWRFLNELKRQLKA